MIASCITASQVDPIEIHPELGVRRDGHLLGQGDAGSGGVDHEQVHVGGSIARAGQDDQTAGRLGEGHVALGARQDEPIAVRLRPDPDALGPEAVLGLQPRRGEDSLAGDDMGQPLLLLGLAARPGQDPAGQDGTHEVGGRGQRAAELLVEHHALDGGHARSAELLGKRQPDEIEVGQLLP
jgi:hypothetical protein